MIYMPKRGLLRYGDHEYLRQVKLWRNADPIAEFPLRRLRSLVRPLPSNAAWEKRTHEHRAKIREQYDRLLRGADCRLDRFAKRGRPQFSWRFFGTPSANRRDEYQFALKGGGIAG
jgi:hypothetical protein